jgi:hypothetical protein
MCAMFKVLLAHHLVDVKVVPVARWEKIKTEG